MNLLELPVSIGIVRLAKAPSMFSRTIKSERSSKEIVQIEIFARVRQVLLHNFV